ncbi:MAG: SUMF1/EgtB/PvdO family nonheme iron enzyme [Ardenticatenaceae bacterium]|nr:SUMF1/EgtB/PvdO family nonheme iron enzyme [Ardenticatenaceae bacterium]
MRPGWCLPTAAAQWGHLPSRLLWRPAYDDYPVIFVSWYNAEAFCDWRGARLPSEAEWEMAAGFDPNQSIVLRYPWGDAFDGTKVNFCDVGCTRDVRDNSVDDGHRDTAPVGSFADGRSPIGTYDMAGNVMEWVSDWYDPRYYESSTDTNPLGGRPKANSKRSGAVPGSRPPKNCGWWRVAPSIPPWPRQPRLPLRHDIAVERLTLLPSVGETVRRAGHLLHSNHFRTVPPLRFYDCW